MVTLSPLYEIVLGYCGVDGVSDGTFPPDDDVVPEDDEPDTEPLFEEDDVLETESLFDEDEVTEVEFDLTAGSFSPGVEESFVAGVLSSAAAGIALYNGDITIKAARRNVSSFALVFFILFSFIWESFFA